MKALSVEFVSELECCFDYRSLRLGIGLVGNQSAF